MKDTNYIEPTAIKEDFGISFPYGPDLLIKYIRMKIVFKRLPFPRLRKSSLYYT